MSTDLHDLSVAELKPKLARLAASQLDAARELEFARPGKNRKMVLDEIDRLQAAAEPAAAPAPAPVKRAPARKAAPAAKAAPVKRAPAKKAAPVKKAAKKATRR